MAERISAGRGRRRLLAHLTDPGLPQLFTRAQARAAGLTDRQIDRRLASGVWVSARRGVFRLGPDIEVGTGTGSWPRTGLRGEPRQPGGVPGSAAGAAVLTAQAAQAAQAILTTHASRDLVLSHLSAALLHALTQPLTGWDRPTATSSSGCTRIRDDIHVLVAPLPEEDVDTSGPNPITSLARTVADCARTIPAADAIALADSAARRGLTRAELDEVLGRQAGWPGVAQARQIAALMSPRRESALESWSAWAFHEWAVPPPDWQVEIRDRRQRFCGRADCWWAPGLAGEADGRAKYALAAAERGGVDARGLSDVLDRERRREQAIRHAGAELVRWGSTDVLSDAKAGELTAFLKSQLARLHRRPMAFTGTALPIPVALTAATA